ncbi:unnamed protein product, partial [Brassica oleracea]
PLPCPSVRPVQSELPPTPGQPTKEPTLIRVVVGLLDSSGKDIILSSVYHDGTQQAISSSSTILRLTKLSQESFFKPICNLTIFVLGFSAPVRVETDLSDDDLFFLLAHDSDEFNRWEAGQVLARKLMPNLVSGFEQNKPLVLNPKFIQGLSSVLSDTSLDKLSVSALGGFASTQVTVQRLGSQALALECLALGLPSACAPHNVLPL